MVRWLGVSGKFDKVISSYPSVCSAEKRKNCGAKVKVLVSIASVISGSEASVDGLREGDRGMVVHEGSVSMSSGPVSGGVFFV